MDWALPNWITGKAETGESERFEQVYRETAGFVRSLVYLLGGEQDLDDIVQEIFIKVWKNLDYFEGRSSLRTWIYRIASNTARDHWRAKSRRKDIPLENFPHPVQPAVDVEMRELIRQGLAALPEDQREAFVLHYYEGFSLKEIADAVESNEGTVKSRLHYGRKALQAFLKAGGLSW